MNQRPASKKNDSLQIGTAEEVLDSFHFDFMVPKSDRLAIPLLDHFCVVCSPRRVFGSALWLCVGFRI